MPKEPSLSLNKRSVDAVKANPSRTLKIAFKEPKGLALIVYPTGRKSFAIRYGEGSQRKMMILGDYGALTVEDAEERVNKFKGEVVKGQDPAAERAKRRATPTFAKWEETYLETVTLKKKSVVDDTRYLKMAAERFGDRPVDRLTASDIQKAFLSLAKEHKTQANRWLASVRACLAAAWREGVIPDNPAMKIRLNPENDPRNRVLDDSEMSRILQAVEEYPEPPVKLAFTLLIETGARLSEVLRAKWDDIDLERGLWRLPSPKAGKVQHIPLTERVVEALKGVPKKSPYIIAGRPIGREREGIQAPPDKPRHDLKKPWAHILDAAKAKHRKAWAEAHPKQPKPPAGFLEGVHIHDLRRSFGLLIAREAGLHVASKLLRHSDIRVTERVYAPLGMDDMRAASEKATKARQKRTLKVINGGKAS